MMQFKNFFIVFSLSAHVSSSNVNAFMTNGYSLCFIYSISTCDKGQEKDFYTKFNKQLS